jgi:hypothetical protein
MKDNLGGFYRDWNAVLAHIVNACDDKKNLLEPFNDHCSTDSGRCLAKAL